MPSPEHQIWKILRLVVIAVTTLALFHWNYINPIEAKDLGTLLGILLSVAGFDRIKTALTEEQAK